MKILLVNKFHYLKGGSETYYFELAKLLEEHGHEVAFFSMENEKNIKTNNKEYFVKEIDMNSKDITKALKVIYNKENKKLMEQALDEFKPDIVHVNNFQRQLTASVIDAAKERNIPVVFTAHDVQAICPAILMMDSQRNICEECMGGKYLNCVKKKCVKNSLLKSVLGAVEAKYYRLKKVYTEKIDYVLPPSEFYMKKLIKDGIPKDKISYIHNFIDVDSFDVKTEDKGYALYFGRLSREKGILNLINAFAKIEKGNLYIAGTGPEQEEVEQVIKDNKLEKRVKLLGFLNKDEMKETIRNCKFVVVPSIWYENCPYSVIETLCTGKPVIGADIGGIPELVKDNENGFIYKYDSIEELSDKMKTLFENDKLVKQFSKKAKEIAKEQYSKENYYKKIIKIYNKVLNK
jgi:glycosyltransferase involved in cell wall biosynthesis